MQFKPIRKLKCRFGTASHPGFHYSKDEKVAYEKATDDFEGLKVKLAANHPRESGGPGSSKNRFQSD